MTRPQRTTLAGVHVNIVPLDPAAHAPALYRGSHAEGHEALWRYLFVGPFPTEQDFRAYLDSSPSSMPLPPNPKATPR
jgi:hypothetical protein